jgi:hypothetical protein
MHVTVDGKHIAGRSPRCYHGNIQMGSLKVDLLSKYASGQMVDGIRSTGKFQSLSGRILGFSRSTIYEFEAGRLIVPGVTWALGEHLITWYVMLIPHQ